MDYSDIKELRLITTLHFIKLPDNQWQITTRIDFFQKDTNNTPANKNFEHTVFHRDLDLGLQICLRELQDYLQDNEPGLVL